MKKLLLPFILLFTIPFNASCIKEIVYGVTITNPDANCEYVASSNKAIRGRNYTVDIISIAEGYFLDSSVDSFWIKIGNFDPIYPAAKGHPPEEGQWAYIGNQLIIYGKIVANDIDIKITPLPIE